MRQLAFLRLPFVCGQTHICEFSPSLHSVNKTKKGLKRDLKYCKSFFQNDGGTGCATLRRRFTHCLWQPAFLRLPFVCGQTHICEFSPSLHSTNKTKKVSKETFFCFIGALGGTRTHNLLIRSPSNQV